MGQGKVFGTLDGRRKGSTRNVEVIILCCIKMPGGDMQVLGNAWNVTFFIHNSNLLIKYAGKSHRKNGFIRYKFDFEILLIII